MAEVQLNYTQAQINDAINKMINLKDYVYPVGSIYISLQSTNPGTIFGGTWQQIEGLFLLGAGGSYIAGNTGGEDRVTLQTTELPAHAHAVEKQYLHRLDTTDTNYANWGANGSLGGWDLANTTNNVGGTRLGIPAHNTNNTGGNQSHNNMPPYLVVYMWKRTA